VLPGCGGRRSPIYLQRAGVSAGTEVSQPSVTHDDLVLAVALAWWRPEVGHVGRSLGLG